MSAGYRSSAALHGESHHTLRLLATGDEDGLVRLQRHSMAQHGTAVSVTAHTLVGSGTVRFPVPIPDAMSKAHGAMKQ